MAGDRGQYFAKRLGSMPIGRLLAVMVLVSILPVWVASYYSYRLLGANERAGIEAGLKLSTRILAGLVDNEIDTHLSLVKALGQSRALAEGDLPTFWGEARRAMEIIPGAWISVNDPRGQLLLSTLAPYGTALPERRETVDLLRALSGREPVISDLRHSVMAQKLSTFVDLPIHVGETPRFILSISMTPERFYSLVKERFTQGELIGILDRQGRFIARIPDNTGRVGTLASEGWRSGIAKAQEGFTYSRSLEGNLTVNAYTTTHHGWVVGIAYLEGTVMAPQRSVLEATAVIVTILTLISLALAVLLARHVAKGIHALANAATTLGESKPMRRVEPPFREAAAISTALENASAELAHAQATLEDKVIARTKELSDEMERRQQIEAQSRQLLRMQAIGQLTGGIAHDFNNMLAIVISSLNLLKRRLAAGRSDVGELIEGGLDGAHRAASLTQRLLAFARQQPLAPNVLELNRMIQSLSDLIRRTIGEEIRIETVLGGGLWPVHADASQLENAILNLAVNARDAMPEGGKLTIETANSHLDDEYVREYSDLASGQYVMVALTDTGTGMSAEEMSRAFEPFYTTKGPGKGTGLGLSQVYGFVKQSRGHAKIYSEMGVGTTVKLYLPRHMGGGEDVVDRKSNGAPIARGSPSECILVVEDEERVRHLSAETLRELGYRVLEADNAVAALKYLIAEPNIALLFTDIVMPDVNGRKLADQALSLNPNLKVLFTTGFTRNAVIHNGQLDAGVNFIAKPFTIEALARKLRDVLDGGSNTM